MLHGDDWRQWPHWLGPYMVPCPSQFGCVCLVKTGRVSACGVALIPEPEYHPDPEVSAAISCALHGEAFIEKGTGRRFIRRPTRH